MFKCFKRFTKSKKGNITIIAIAIVPMVLLLFSSVVATNRRENVQKSEFLVSVDSFCEYQNKIYGTALRDTGDFFSGCIYSERGKSEYGERFKEYFTKLDGYNPCWSYEFEFIDGERDTSVAHIVCHLYFPKISTSMSSVDYFGVYNGSEATDGWYKDNENTMKVIYKELRKDLKKSTASWTYQRVEVFSSCA